MSGGGGGGDGSGGGGGTCHVWLQNGRCARAHCPYAHALPAPCHYFFSAPGGCSYGDACRFLHAPAPAPPPPIAPPGKHTGRLLLAQAAAAREQFAECVGAAGSPRFAPACIAALGEELKAILASLAGVEGHIEGLKQQQVALCGQSYRGVHSRKPTCSVCVCSPGGVAHLDAAAALEKQRDLAFFAKKKLQKKARKLEDCIRMLSSELRNKRSAARLYGGAECEF